MPDNYEKYISKHLITLYRKKLFGPFFYLLVVGAMFMYFPTGAFFSPSLLTTASSLEEKYLDNDLYNITTLSDLHFTGYTKTKYERTVGYYYYYKDNDKQFSIVLLSPSTCEQGLPTIDSVTTFFKIMPSNDTFNDLLENLAKSLNWSFLGIRSKVMTYYLSEPDYQFTSGLILFLFILITGLFALVQLLSCFLYLFVPHLSPPIRRLRPFGRPKELLQQAEEELSTLPQLATEDMFITEHFFIETSKFGIALIPINEITWIYKHSTLHKLFWYHFSISYTLHINANKKIYIDCPRNIKSDIDGIIDYLSEANHDILIGFNEENRQIIHERQGKFFHLERLVRFLQKRV